MRYVINDDDFEDWIKQLTKVMEHIEYGVSDGEDIVYLKLSYVISQMMLELTQHFKEESIEKLFPFKLDNP